MDRSPYSEPELVAGCDQLALPAHFAAPARDLVALAELAPGSWVLDLGSGTGAITIPAAAAVGPAGRIVALDPSLPMLLTLRTKGVACDLVAGAAPHLPFRDRCFDAVLGNFVLSHLEDPVAALADIRRTLRRHGRVGFTSWAPIASALVALWDEIASRHVALDDLRAASRRVIPWGERFSNAAEMGRVLEAAGFVDIVLERRPYPVRMRTSEYLTMRDASVEGVLLRRLMDGAAWDRCRGSMATEFEARFGATVEYARDVHLGCGVVAS